MLVGTSAKVTPLYRMIVGFIDKTSAGNTAGDYLKANNSVAVNSEKGFLSNTGLNVTTDAILENYGKTVLGILEGVFTKNRIPIKSTSRFNALTGSVDAGKFVETAISSMGEIIKFLTVYTFYSYFCEYTGELAAEVEVKRQDVMDFPNYCLVVPVEIMKTIYGALSADNFKKLIEDPKSSNTDFEEITTQSLNKIISVIGNRLGVSNIMVVDEKSKMVYYKWMFNKQVQRINLGTLKSYVSSQREFIKAS